MQSKKIVVADDHTLFRSALKAILGKAGYDVVAEAATGHDALRAVQEHLPSLVILDIHMPLLNGIEACRLIRERVPGSPVLLLTMASESVYVEAALEAGARGYVLKTQASQELLQAMEDVQRGATYLSPGISDELSSRNKGVLSSL